MMHDNWVMMPVRYCLLQGVELAFILGMLVWVARQVPRTPPEEDRETEPYQWDWWAVGAALLLVILLPFYVAALLFLYAAYEFTRS